MTAGLSRCPSAPPPSPLLRFLNLSNNPLGPLEPGLFNPLTCLRVLDLSATDLPSVDPTLLATMPKLVVRLPL